MCTYTPLQSHDHQEQMRLLIASSTSFAKMAKQLEFILTANALIVSGNLTDHFYLFHLLYSYSGHYEHGDGHSLLNLSQLALHLTA